MHGKIQTTEFISFRRRYLKNKILLLKNVNKITKKAYAKVNLTLDIITRNYLGYHNIESVMQQLNLHDNVKLMVIKKGININSNNHICSDEKNLAYKAAELLMENFKINKGVEINIEKNIPIAAGLGGGSADAAATLKGMNKIFKLNLSKNELIEISKGIGVDVAFCLMGGTAYATGRGNELQKIKDFPMFYVVLAKPKFGILAKHAYKSLDYEKTGIQLKTAEMLYAIREKNIKKIAESMHNDFEYSICNEYPIINEIKENMIEYGALNALMSGSGPTVFGITKDKVIAENIQDRLKKDTYFNKKLDFVYLTKTR